MNLERRRYGLPLFQRGELRLDGGGIGFLVGTIALALLSFRLQTMTDWRLSVFGLSCWDGALNTLGMHGSEGVMKPDPRIFEILLQRQRIAPESAPLLAPRWEDDPEFDLDDHVSVAVLPEPASETELKAYVESLMRVPLDRDHALWEMHVVESYDGGGSAVVCRFHHAIADGIALAQVLLSLTDEQPDGDLDGGSDDTAARSGWMLSVPGLGAARSLLSGATRAARPSVVRDAVTLAAQTAHVADKLLLGSNPPGPLLGDPGPDKRAVWSRPHPVAQIRAIGRASDATVNDVLVAAVAGALSSYVVERGGRPQDLTTMVPVNLRPIEIGRAHV